MTASIDIQGVLQSLEELPSDWHPGGMLTVAALRGIARHAGSGVASSAETGSGRSTLLLSHLSQDHLVFSIDGAGSLTRARTSTLLRTDRVRFVEGPSQLTLRDFVFERPLELILIDGSHAYPVPELDYYHLYPHLAPGGLLILDDIHIPTIRSMFRFLREDAMYELLEVVGHTAFFKRGAATTFDPLWGDWFDQRYNSRHFPLIERLKLRISPRARQRIGALIRRG